MSAKMEAAYRLAKTIANFDVAAIRAENEEVRERRAARGWPSSELLDDRIVFALDQAQRAIRSQFPAWKADPSPTSSAGEAP